MLEQAVLVGPMEERANQRQDRDPDAGEADNNSSARVLGLMVA